MTALSKTRLYELMGNDEFPHQVPIGARAVGWYDDEVQEWIRRRDESRDTIVSRVEREPSQGEPTQNPKGNIAHQEQPPRRHDAKGDRDRRSHGGPSGSGRSANLERIGKTSDGREMLWDRTTGNVLIVIGHLSADGTL